MKNILFYLKNPEFTCRRLLGRIHASGLLGSFFKFPRPTETQKKLECLVMKSEGKPVFVFPSPGCPWGYMFQRPQQLASALAELGYKVIYCVDLNYPDDPDWSVRGLVKAKDNLYLLNDGLGGDTLKSIKDYIVVWQYWPHQRSFIENVEGMDGPIQSIYDCIDEITTFSTYPTILQDHEKSLRTANFVLATSRLIFKSIKERRPDVLLVPNGVNASDFELQNIEHNPSLIPNEVHFDHWVGYYGAIASWFDQEFVEIAAKEHPTWGFVIVGEVYPDIKRIKLPNVFYTGRVAYTWLPRLLKDIDVAILPFKINDITLSTSPVKVYEYLSAGLPVVSTALPEVIEMELPLVAKNPVEFSRLLDDALLLKLDKDYIARCKEFVQKNTWSERVRATLSQIERRTD